MKGRVRRGERVVTVRSEGPEETIGLGRAIGRCLAAGHVLCVTGSLGSGKTVLTQGIVEGIRGDCKGVRSPSFTLVNEYPGPLLVHHVDLYRIGSGEEIVELGLEEILGSNSGAVIVEWGEKLGDLAPTDRLAVRIEVEGPESRRFRFRAHGPRHGSILSALSRGQES
jgi:tRNA threonylcarbamoyladenosine biosynthesis protein TsaE